jgi:hypothetical protein
MVKNSGYRQNSTFGGCREFSPCSSRWNARTSTQGRNLIEGQRRVKGTA